jgi:hypothetical protein
MAEQKVRSQSPKKTGQQLRSRFDLLRREDKAKFSTSPNIHLDGQIEYICSVRKACSKPATLATMSGTTFASSGARPGVGRLARRSGGPGDIKTALPAYKNTGSAFA